jgi:hypothetical protein
MCVQDDGYQKTMPEKGDRSCGLPVENDTTGVSLWCFFPIAQDPAVASSGDDSSQTRIAATMQTMTSCVDVMN